MKINQLSNAGIPCDLYYCRKNIAGSTMGHNVMDIPSIEAIIQHVTTPVGRK